MSAPHAPRRPWWGSSGPVLVVGCLVTLVALLGAVPAQAVVGGRGATADGVPVVALWVGDGGAPGEGRPTCTGVLVAADLVLTAGHCVSDGRAVTVQPYELRAAVGGRDVRRVGADPAARGERVVGVSRHPDARAEAGRGEVDLAVLRLRTPVRGVRPLSPSTGRVAAAAARRGAALRVTGYGATSFRGDTVLRRRTVGARVLSWRAARKGGPLAGLSPRRVLPLGGRTGRGVACFGDSGAPVLDRRGALVGLVSGGLAAGDCRAVGTAAVRLAEHRSWILSGGRVAPSPTSAPEVPDGAAIGRAATCRVRVPEGVRYEAWWERQLTPTGTVPALGGVAKDRPEPPSGAGREEVLSTDVTGEDDGWRLRCVVMLVGSDGQRSVSRSMPVDVRATTPVG